MDEDEIRETILSWDEMLPDKMKMYIHYRSIQGFLFNVDKIPGDIDKPKILALLEEYIEEVKAGDYDFRGAESVELARKYLDPIAKYFLGGPRFYYHIGLDLTIIISVLGDGFLYITTISARFHHIPVVTILFFSYYFFQRIYLIPRKRTYGQHY